jgi:hypothetical protein
MLTHLLSRRGGHMIVVGLLLSGLGPAAAWAQQPPARPQPPTPRPAPTRPPAPRRRLPPKWTFELHAGGMFSQSTSGATPISGVFGPVGASFTTQGGFSSRAVSSWVIGDGTALFNQVQTDFSSRFGIRFPQIVPLDATVSSSFAARKTGISIGGRLTRVLTRRASLEIDVTRAMRPLALQDAARAGVEATRASFETGFSGLLATVPQLNLGVTSVVEGGADVGGQTAVTGAVRISAMRRGKLETYVTAGAGLVFNGSEALELTLRSNYQFSILDTFPINETDTVTIRVSDPSKTAVGVGGAGFQYAFAARHGVQFDVRVLAGRNETRTVVSATPRLSLSAPAAFLPSLTSPSVQFSSVTEVPTTLSGASIRDLETFKGSGLDLRPQVSVAYTVKF